MTERKVPRFPGTPSTVEGGAKLESKLASACPKCGHGPESHGAFTCWRECGCALMFEEIRGWIHYVPGHCMDCDGECDGHPYRFPRSPAPAPVPPTPDPRDAVITAARALTASAWWSPVRGPGVDEAALTGLRDALAALDRAAPPAPPVVCTGSGRPAGNLYLSNTGRGTCGICGQDVQVGPDGNCTTHPWRAPPAPGDDPAKERR